ncbi:hypothetical protein JTE90_005218 [Oedothorax gibbosus]|uniref:Uncharacterized protein n=1 Tax=Oedothorax gibbosus TaxID=931172 RepID=A0AAV6UJL1_9ARAC|nr:hypothetical protein JTE90_005218 [Oedothorax gibbosus]
MAACPEETPKEPRKIYTENTLNHERNKNSCNELVNLNKNHNNFSEGGVAGEVSTLSEAEFLQLMIEASTFNKSSSQESPLLQKLREDNPITDTEPPPPRTTGSSRSSHLPSSRTSDGRKKHTRNSIHQSQSLQDLLATPTEDSSGGSRGHQRRRQAHRTHSLSSEDVDADSLALLKKLGKKSRKQDMCSNLPKGAEDGASSPLEIKEIQSPAEESSSQGEPSSNGVAASNSKFYVDCNDVDSTVSFPLKLVSSLEGEQGGGGGRFPIVPWPRPLQVQSFFSSLPMDTDTFSGSDKQALSTDINGNPFASRSSRSSNLASFVSSTLMDYSSGGGANDATKNRKNKRTHRNTANNKGVLSENIAGHRGKDDIDSLLQFINSSDKKAKQAKGGQVDQKKALVKSGGQKKKRSSSLENIRTTSSNDVFLFEPRPDKVLDINSNEESNHREDVAEEGVGHSSTESSLRASSPEAGVSSFAADFYSMRADVSSQTVEGDSGFSVVVKKKQRKKHQGKLRSEAHRWRNAQAQQRKKGLMLPLSESKCGKQDARRKSTSSVPHSDPSSADNSDLDSVHSLPVRGSVPHPTRPHPHTTPSSSSSTPQASYADIARMTPSVKAPPLRQHEGKESSPNPALAKSQEGPSLKRRSSEVSAGPGVHLVERETEMPPSSVDAEVKVCSPGISGSSGIDTIPAVSGPSNPVPCPGVLSSGAALSGSTSTVPGSSVTPDAKVMPNPKSTREINTQTEPESVIEKSDVSSAKKCDQPSPRNECASCSLCKNLCACSKPAMCATDAPTKETSCGVCSSRKSCTCSKPAPAVRSKSLDIPPVIMDNMPEEANPCDVSFGFGIEEVLDMTSTDPESPQSSDSSGIVVIIRGSETDARSSPPSRAAADLSPEQSSHVRRVSYGGDRNLCYTETNVNVKRFNHSELTRFLGNEFYSIEKEINGISGRRNRPRVEYYVDSSEDA